MLALELVTPPLDGMVLPGVTRDSVISLAKGHASKQLVLDGLTEDFEFSERSITMQEVKAASQNGTLVELFGTGKCFHVHVGCTDLACRYGRCYMSRQQDWLPG